MKIKSNRIPDVQSFTLAGQALLHQWQVWEVSYSAEGASLQHQKSLIYWLGSHVAYCGRLLNVHANEVAEGFLARISYMKSIIQMEFCMFINQYLAKSLNKLTQYGSSYYYLYQIWVHQSSVIQKKNECFDYLRLQNID